jgi:hypothetical protein
MTVALSEDQAYAGAEVARLARENPSAFDTPNDLGGVQQHFPFPVHEVSRDDTESVTDIDAEINRYLAEHSGMFGRDKPQSGNRKGRLAGRYPGTGPSGKPQNAIVR